MHRPSMHPVLLQHTVRVTQGACRQTHIKLKEDTKPGALQLAQKLRRSTSVLQRHCMQWWTHGKDAAQHERHPTAGKHWPTSQRQEEQATRCCRCSGKACHLLPRLHALAAPTACGLLLRVACCCVWPVTG